MRNGVLCPWVSLPGENRDASSPPISQKDLNQLTSNWSLLIEEAGSQPQ